MISSSDKSISLGQLVCRAVALRCPVCGQGKLYKSAFVMHRQCAQCGNIYEREPGFFLGAIYFNYGFTALTVAIAYPLLLFNEVLPRGLLMGLALGFVVIFPLCMFRFARALWLGFDQRWDPRMPLSSANNEDNSDGERPAL